MKWLSVIDEDDAETKELSSLPSLQRLVERMESQKGRVLHNEAASRAEEGGYTAEDEVGRQRLLSLCREFLTRCRKLSTEEETQQLFWRVQALATNKPLEALCRKLCAIESLWGPCALESLWGPCAIESLWVPSMVITLCPAYGEPCGSPEFLWNSCG